MPGALDSNKIYITTEDDSASPFSEVLNRLARSVSDALAPTPGAYAITAASGWTINQADLVRVGKLLTVSIIVTKTAAIVGPELVLTLPTTARPAAATGFGGLMLNGGTQAACGIDITTGGAVTVSAGSTANKQVRFTVTYRLA